MASQTLVQAKLFINNEIVQGVAETLIDVNPMYAVLPFDGYEGQAVLVNREVTLGNTETLAVDTTISAKTAATNTQSSFTATRLIGDVEMDELVALQSAGAGVDQMAIEIRSKAKSISRLFQTGMATGSGTSPAMNSFHYLLDTYGSTQYTTATGGTTSQALSFALMDEMLDLVLAKDGQVDWIMCPARTMRSYKVLLRALGGTAMDDVITLPDGRTVIGYEGIPIFKNTYLSTTETADGAALVSGTMTSMYAGCWDDGSRRVGVAAIHPVAAPAGITVKMVGAMESKDSSLVRVVQYANLLTYNIKGIARLTSLSN